MENPADEPIPSYFINWAAVESVLDQGRAFSTTGYAANLIANADTSDATKSSSSSGIRTIFLFQHDGSLLSYSGHRHHSKLVPSLCSHILSRINSFPPLISLRSAGNDDLNSNHSTHINSSAQGDEFNENRSSAASTGNAQQPATEMAAESQEAAAIDALSSSVALPSSIPSDLPTSSTTSSLLLPSVLRCMIIKCEQGALCVANLTHFLLCVEGDETIAIGMLKKRTEEVVQALNPLLNVYGTLEESN